jgi:hypothetical protein
MNVTNVEIALHVLAAQADPHAVLCLRCCAKKRLAIIALANCDPAKCDRFTFIVTDEAIDAEVARLRAGSPVLAARFDAHGHCAYG